MDGYQFAAAILQSLTSLAWPAAVVACVWLFREKLNTLLPMLRMKYKDIDISFRLDKAEEEAKALPPPSEDGPTHQPKTPEEKSRFEQLAEISPRSAILEIRRELEEVVNSLAREKGVDTGMIPFNLMSATRSLRNLKIIDRHTSALLDDLRAIGNSAAHAGRDADFTLDEAMRVRKLADQVISQINIQVLRQ